MLICLCSWQPSTPTIPSGSDVRHQLPGDNYLTTSWIRAFPVPQHNRQQGYFSVLNTTTSGPSTLLQRHLLLITLAAQIQGASLASQEENSDMFSIFVVC